MKFQWFYLHVDISNEPWIHETLIFVRWLKHCDSMITRRNFKFLIFQKTCCIFWGWLEDKIHKTLMFARWLEHNESMSWRKPLVFLAKMNQKLARSSPPLGAQIRDSPGEECKPPTFAPPTKNFAPLICRVVRAVRAVRGLGAGLGFPVGPPLHSGFHPQPQT